VFRARTPVCQLATFKTSQNLQNIPKLVYAPVTA
jgi:hypothetical protein